MKWLKRCLNCYLECFDMIVTLLACGRLPPPLCHWHNLIH
jgi:hypothetical protein